MGSFRKEDSAFWKDISAPVIVAVPPSFARNNMCFCANGNIRHYGKEMIGGEVTQVYIESEDMGLTWKKHLRSPDDPGAMVKCPWADYFLTLQGSPELTAYRSVRGPGFPADKKVVIGLKAKEPRPLLPLKSRKRWIAAISNVSCTNNTCYKAAACYSDDDGDTWTYVDVPETPGIERQFACDKYPHWFNDGCEPTIAELPDGTLLMALRSSGEFVPFSRSTDGGETWEVPKPRPGFWQANTMPELRMLRDGRLLFVWNNTAMLPTRDIKEFPELPAECFDGAWETVFTNRDVLHAAISEDNGKTWIGYREIILDGIRNNGDFRELGNDNAQEHDKSVHQTQMLELDNGKILLALGQNTSARKIVIFDPAWLYEKTREEDFRHGLGNISHHLYVKSLMCGWNGWAGHCAWNRHPGVVLEREPDQGLRGTGTWRESMHLCRLNDPRLVSAKAGAVWNFPAGRKGKLEIDFRIEGEGFQIALQDHWSNPCDEYLVPRSALVFPVTPEEFSKAKWETITLEWDCDKANCVISCGNVKKTLPLNLEKFAQAGPSYLHLQTLAEKEDLKGVFFRGFRKS